MAEIHYDNVSQQRLMAKLFELRDMICTVGNLAGRSSDPDTGKETIQLHDPETDKCMLIITIPNFHQEMKMIEAKMILNNES